MNCPKCGQGKRVMEYLRSVSNQTRNVGFYLHARCGTVVVVLGNPSTILAFKTGPSSLFTTSTSHAKVAVKKRDLRSVEVHARHLKP